MALKRNIAPTLDSRKEEPFATPEDAWAWYSRCQLARDEGARFQTGLGDIARPCAPDDIARELRRLYRSRVLRGAHLRVLARFSGETGTTADDDSGTGRLWREALDRLGERLRAKGIVA
ncbi:hypothetical protein [Paramagnetospirillum magneticum]|uniref:Uncharacterized protein n=1 Tax=Paramagnetospirillum magneticum (strain ATCC 700264 / AMB-1) TaxID=342108 RepID=Q2VZE1_PARM1|nr:hypothetical protein [Paramagnetospirillum magneticum]BAE53034.1 hypothetical protein amb4230 [Paramagnetospirillum magneticum AMB-1]